MQSPSKMLGFCTVVAALGIAGAFIASVVQAQISRVGASIEGQVTDSSGGIIAHAALTVKNSSTNQIRSLTSDDEGSFHASELSVGSYDVDVDHAGFAPYRLSNVVLSLGQTVELTVVLSPASAVTEVRVAAKTSPLDISQTSVVSSIDQERIEELPVHTRNYLDFVLLAPGVSDVPTATSAGASTPMAGSGFTFAGLRPQSNNVLIDGLDNNDEFTGSSRTELSPEIVQEFQVVNNGLSAESGGASGGSINVVTRSGANVVHGDGFIFAQDSAFNAREPFEEQPGKPSYRRFREGLALGGAIVKGKTFYYAAVEQEHSRGQIGSDIDPSVASAINSLLASGAFPALPTRQITTGFSATELAETEAAGRLDHRLTKSTALMLRYAFTNNKEVGNAFNTDGLFDASSSGSSFTSDSALSGSLTTVLGSEAVSDFRFQAATRRAVLRTAQSNGPEIDIAGSAIFGRPYAGNSERRENHYQVEYKYTRNISKHLWSIGATGNRIRERGVILDGFGGVYLFGSVADFLAGNADQLRQSFGNVRVDFPVTGYGAFVQDHWQARRHLVADVGIRYDFEHLPAGFNQDANNFSPRVGLAWSPLDKLTFRVGYGVFFDRSILSNLTRAVQMSESPGFQQVVDGIGAAGIFAGAGGGSLLNPVTGVAPSSFRPEVRMPTPYSQQTSAGAEYLLTKSLILQADYLDVHGVKLPRTVNVNLSPPSVLTGPILSVPNPTPQQLGREVFSSPRINSTYKDIYELQNAAGSLYNGASFTLRSTVNEDFEFSASYTVSRTYDDASNFDEQPQNRFNLPAERALSRQNQDQKFVFNALWDLPIGDDEDGGHHRQHDWVVNAFSHIELAPIFTAGSGRPVNVLTGLDSSHSHAFPLSSRPLGFGRNAVNTPATATLDLRVVKYFPLGEFKHLDCVVESFNLLNRPNVAQINSVFGSELNPIKGFGQPTEALGARQIEFSLDFEF